MDKLEDVKAQFGPHPADYIKDKVLYKQTKGFTAIYCLKNDIDEIEAKIN